MRFLRGMFIFIFLMGLMAVRALADDVSFEATVNSNKTSLNNGIQLTLTVTGYKDSLDPITLPMIDGFDARYVGPSTIISIVNGAYSSEKSFNYQLAPTKVGHFQIPAISLSLGGKNYSSKPIDVDVVDAPTQQGANAGVDQVTSESLRDKIILKMSIPSENVYLNEKVPLTIKLYVKDIPMRDIQMPKLEQGSFIVDAFQQPKQYTQALNGMDYELVEFKTFIYPTQVGDIAITPAKIEGNLIFKKSRQGAFGDDFFNSIFESYAARPVTASSNNVRLNVQPLPEEKPKGFNGAVGQFDFTASVSPTEIKVGDPLTLRMTINGSGNLKNARFPQFIDSWFKTYDPQIKDIEGGKTAEQVIIPIDEKVNSLEALHFVYFDPLVKEYKTITQGPFALKVVKADPNQEFKAMGFAELNDKPGLSSLGAAVNINPWMEWRDKVLIGARQLIHQPWFWLMIAFLVISVVSWKIWSAYRNRLVTDTAFARRMKAFKGAKEGMAQAENALSKQDVKGFYAAVQKTVNNYFADRMHKGLGAVSAADIESFLKIKGVNGEILESLTKILSFCEAVRFGGVLANPSQMQDDFAQLQLLLSNIEKKIK